jgi:hypothetical protein
VSWNTRCQILDGPSFDRPHGQSFVPMARYFGEVLHVSGWCCDAKLS